MYQNIGKKIKFFAILIFVLQVIGALVGCAILFLEELILFALLTLVSGPIFAYFISILIYGYGELIENTSDISLSNSATAISGRKTLEIAQTTKRTESAKSDLKIMIKSDEFKEQKSPGSNMVTPVTAPQKAEKTLKEHLTYSLKYETDEGLISYLKGVNNELVQNILTNPTSSVRELVKHALENLD
jgi:hypothetical protein